MEACQEQGVEQPTWRWDGAFVYVTFKRPLKQMLINDDVKQDPEKKTSKHDPSTTQVRLLIEIMNAEYVSLKDIMSLLNPNSAKRFRENYLNPAIEDGALVRLYPNNHKHPKQKYRLTEEAIEWKHSLQ